MTTRSHKRTSLLLALLLGAAPAVFGNVAQQVDSQNDQFEGKVTPLAGLLQKEGAKLDGDAAIHFLALAANDGKIYTLIKDDGSRMFFLDKSLRDRPMRLTARLIPQSQMLQVIGVNSLIKGQLHEVYYWCETCAIRDSEPGDCHCCGDKFVLTEKPVK